MTTSRRYNQDWDPMREDFDNSNYDPQNADESGGGFVNLDHCRLYITNIPNGLSDDGLSTAFSKYGQLTEVFVSRNPDKRYALVSFETPGEAKFAMMKLNRTEPLRLNINVAHKSGAKTKRPLDKKDSSGYRSTNSNPRNREDRSFRDDASAGSRSNTRRQESLANGDNMEDLVDDDVKVLSGGLEPGVNLELEKLKLEHLKLQEAQVLCKHRMLLIKQAEKKTSASSRQILPDGRIVVRTVDKSEVIDAEGSFGAGAGDAHNLPALLNVGACVACGERASAFCSGCRVTPYCSPACQRRDWAHRHKTVCHNLKRQSGGIASRLENDSEPVIPAAAPLRRPRSPAAAAPAPPAPPAPAARDPGPDRMPPKKFGPPGNATAPTPVARANNRDDRGPDIRGRSDNRDQGDRDRSDNRDQGDRGRSDKRDQGDRGRSDKRDQGDRDRCDNRDQGDRGRSNNRGSDNRGNRSNDGDDKKSRTNDRNKDNSYFGTKNNEVQESRPRNQDAGNRYSRHQSGAGKPKDDEDWGPKPEQKPEEPTPSFGFKPKTGAVPKEAKLKSSGACAPTPAAAPKPTLVPKNCVIDLLPVNDTFVLSVDSIAESCDSGKGFVCVTLHGDYSDNYERLLEPFGLACEASEGFEPGAGDTFAYLEAGEGAWYRARRLGPARAALLDAARVVPLAPADSATCRRLPADFAVVPEFCAHLDSDKVQLKDQVQCSIVSKSGDALNVSLVNLETGAALGAGVVRRWLPRVHAPAHAPTDTTAHANDPSPPPPEVPRPAVSPAGGYVLVDGTAPARVFVRPAARAQQAEFDEIVCEVALYGAAEDTPRLKELPTVGQTVVARFTDGNHYRALVQRVSSKNKRCLLEFIEYGNAMIVEDLDSLCPCPDEFTLAARPTLTSHVTLQMKQEEFSDAATAYLDKLKDDVTELTLTIPSGEKTGPSKTPVRLTISQSKEEVNRTVDSLSTPEWQKIMERGGDVLETETFTFSQIKYVDPPASGGEMVITDCSLLQHGIVSGHHKNAEHARKAFALTPRMEEYCNSPLGQDPYLPKLEELCIAKCPKKKQWLRAVMMEQGGGPGGAEAAVLFYDHGHVATVPVSALRKMMPEFARDIPAAVCSLVIKDFPQSPTADQLERAKQHLQMSDLGVGALRVTRCVWREYEEHLVTAPDLINAIH